MQTNDQPEGGNTPTVRQTTRPSTIRIWLAIALVAYILSWYLHREFPDTIPDLHFGVLVFIPFLSRALQKSMIDPLDKRGSLEFYRDPIAVLLLLLLPTGIVYLLFAHAISVSPSVALVSYLCSLIIGLIASVQFGSHKIVLKEHDVTFVHGLFARKSKTILYGDISDIAVSAATDGITVTTKDGTKETYLWMGGLDNLKKLLYQRVQAAPAPNVTQNYGLTIEELASRRLRGVISDQEFNAELQRRSS